MADTPRDGWSAKNEARARDAGHDSYDAWIEAEEEELGYEICGAWAKTPERPCHQRYRAGNRNGRCRRHEGGGLVGAAHPAHKHGRYSEVLDGAIGRGYDASTTEEGDGLSLREERALADGWREELVDRLAQGGADFGDLVAATLTLDREVLELDEDEELDREKVEDAVEALRDSVDSFRAMESTWEGLRALAEHKRRLVETERRTLEARVDAMSRVEVLTIIRFLGNEVVAALREHVDETQTQRAVLKRLYDAIGRLDAGGRRGDREDRGREVEARGNGRPVE